MESRFSMKIKKSELVIWLFSGNTKVTFMWLDVEKEGHEGALQFFGLEAPKEGGKEINNAQRD